MNQSSVGQDWPGEGNVCGIGRKRLRHLMIHTHYYHVILTSNLTLSYHSYHSKSDSFTPYPPHHFTIHCLTPYHTTPHHTTRHRMIPHQIVSYKFFSLNFAIHYYSCQQQSFFLSFSSKMKRCKLCYYCNSCCNNSVGCSLRLSVIEVID